MTLYKRANLKLWNGRSSGKELYWHEIVEAFNPEKAFKVDNRTIVFLGYQCDEGVRRNQGRPGTKKGPNAIRLQLGGLSNHFKVNTNLLDAGDIIVDDEDMEAGHEMVSQKVKDLLDIGAFPILFGGGHDLAYAHFSGLRRHIGDSSSIGIVNLDAHFDLRKPDSRSTSGTPFYEILSEDTLANYLCLGIQKAANNAELFEAAHQFGVHYLNMYQYQLANWYHITAELSSFIDSVDHIYLTIDLDGFASAYAPGVSAPSPMGFDPHLAYKTIQTVRSSGKLRSADIVELNPKYDIDNSTARLAARMVHALAEG
ncbi:formimidoylglutamase [Marinoscillum sp. MHG1-6]|uniref:formimidoylglutamase n=1 Tax=Marinoscillum sp. MHG1-6 TaxID=2959627 RepID=UPI0021572ADD|nr:formimidoylglutamase [Marinoscillum sp. MHG1-6]